MVFIVDVVNVLERKGMTNIERLLWSYQLISHLSENLKVVLASERESRGQRWRDAVDDEIAVVVQENGRTVVLGGDLEGHLGTAES